MQIARRNALKLGGLVLLGAIHGQSPAAEGTPPAPAQQSSSGPSPGGEEWMTALRSGGYVILMRHASSPRTPPDAAHSDPENVDHERQLDEGGRASARALGEALRHLHIPVGPVFASPTYRALETARLAAFSPVKTFEQLGDQGNSMMAERSAERGAWLRRQAAVRPPRGSNTLIITHLPNITEAFPEGATGLEDGEALIFLPDGQGGTKQVARVKIGEWPSWAGVR
jgi:phosphohistidine phosphatase SixA